MAVEKPIVLASANPHKVREIRDLLKGWSLAPRPDSVPDVDEVEETLVGNARLKATALVKATGHPAVADDTGLEVDALGGRPGVHSKRYASEDATDEENVAFLLKELEGVAFDDRTARFRTIAFLGNPDGQDVVGDGVVEGLISEEPLGTNGFGYDVVFIPDEGDGRTFAEMTTGEKHAISHRGRAFRNLREQVEGT